jgi:hypothetical protein
MKTTNFPWIKTIIACSITLLFAAKTRAQDVITTTSGETIASKIIQIDENNVTYELSGSPGKGSLKLPLAQVAKITFADGRIKEYNALEPVKSHQPYLEPAPYSQPYGTTIPPPQTERRTKNNAFFLSWHAAPAMPAALYMGGLVNGASFYVGGRANPGYLSADTDVTVFAENGKIYSDYYLYSPTGEAETLRASVTAGVTLKLIGEVKRISLHAFGGAGYGAMKVTQEYLETDVQYGYSYDVLAEHIDRARSGVEVEGGLIFNLYVLNFNLGVSTLGFKDPIGTFGFGFSF